MLTAMPGVQAQNVSVFMMLTIMLSIVSLTFASIPENQVWVDVWISNITHEVIEGRYAVPELPM